MARNSKPAPGAIGAGEGECLEQQQCRQHSQNRSERKPGTFVLVLRPEPGVDGDRALRAALKRLLRDHGLRCTGAREARHD